ncbi:MAG: hypothetical protein M9962_14775 [Oligoflexia bacterium]|nr:hypothetical protein [Oligoflexia bacterium]
MYLILATENRNFPKPTNQILASANFQFCTFTHLSEYFFSQNTQKAHVTIIEIGSVEDFERAKIISEWEECGNSGASYRMVFVFASKNIYQEFSKKLKFHESFYFPLSDKNLLFKLELQHRLLEASDKQEEKTLFQFEGGPQKKDRVFYIKGPSNKQGQWKKHETAPEGGTRWCWIENTASLEERKNYFQWTVKSDTEPTYEEAQSAWMIQSTNPDLNYSTRGRLVLSLTPELESNKNKNLVSKEDTKDTEKTNNDGVSVSEIAKKSLAKINTEKLTSTEETKTNKQIKPSSSKTEQGHTADTAKTKSTNIESESTKELIEDKKIQPAKAADSLNLNSTKKTSEKSTSKNDEEPNAIRPTHQKNNAIEEKDDIKKSFYKESATNQSSAFFSKKTIETISSSNNSKTSQHDNAKEAEQKNLKNDQLSSSLIKESVDQGEIRTKEFVPTEKALNNQTKVHSQVETNNKIIETISAVELENNNKKEINDLERSDSTANQKNNANSGSATENAKEKSKISPNLKDYFAKKNTYNEQITKDSTNENSDPPTPVDTKEQILSDDLGNAEKTNEGFEKTDVPEISKKDNTEESSEYLPRSFSKKSKIPTEPITRLSQNIIAPAKVVVSGNYEPRQEEPIYLKSRHFIIKSLEELHDDNSTWHPMNKVRIYLSAKHRYFLKIKLEDLFPLWIYEGELAPEFLEKQKAWKFYDRPPILYPTIEHLPIDLKVLLNSEIKKTEEEFLKTQTELKIKKDAEESILTSEKKTFSTVEPSVKKSFLEKFLYWVGLKK